MKLTNEQNITLISSQRYRDPDVIQSYKDDLEDDGSIEVSYIYFEYDGEAYWVITDGHHRYDAARALGANAMFRADSKKQAELEEAIESGELLDYLDKISIDSDYYNLETMEDIEW